MVLFVKYICQFGILAGHTQARYLTRITLISIYCPNIVYKTKCKSAEKIDIYYIVDDFHPTADYNGTDKYKFTEGQ